jgi:3-methyladenine DNA glycosylase AlkD
MGLVDEAVAEMTAALVPLGRPERAAGSKAYLKSDDDFLGVATPLGRPVFLGWLRRARPDDATVLAVADRLWQSHVFEHRWGATELLTARAGQLGPGALDRIEAMVRHAGTWALVDPLSYNAAGTILTVHPEVAGAVDGWVADGSFWVRRLSVLCLSRPVRAGVLPFATLASVADRLLEEKELFVRKAIGWALRDIGRHEPDAVADFLLPRMGRVSGVTWREARKPLPAPAVAGLEALRRPPA